MQRKYKKGHMAKVLILHLNRSRYALETVDNWLRSQGHEVTTILTPKREDLSNYHPGLFQIKQILTGAWQHSKGPEYDVAISTESYSILGLIPALRKKRIKKLIFWRIDRRNGRFLGLSGLGDSIASRYSEVWSIVANRRDKYVPFLLDEFDFRDAGRTRLNRIIWTGPDPAGYATLVTRVLLQHPEWGMNYTLTSTLSTYIAFPSISDTAKQCG